MLFAENQIAEKKDRRKLVICFYAFAVGVSMMSVFGDLLFGGEVHYLRNKIIIQFVIVNKTT